MGREGVFRGLRSRTAVSILLILLLGGGDLRMDDVDFALLQILQEDATLKVAEIAQKVGLSVTPCWRRIQKLEEEGVIRKRVALLDPVKLQVGVTVFIAVRTNQHNAAWVKKFSAIVMAIPEIVEFYRMSGDVDYLLRAVVPDIAGYDAVYKRLIEKIELGDVSSSFAMEQIKFTTALPLQFAMSSEAASRSEKDGKS
jgi:Lrp/AsnC family transcriptional regulator